MIHVPSLSSKSNSASLSLTSAGRLLTSTIGIVVTVVDPDEDRFRRGTIAAAAEDEEDMIFVNAVSSPFVKWICRMPLSQLQHGVEVAATSSLSLSLSFTSLSHTIRMQQGRRRRVSLVIVTVPDHEHDDHGCSW